MAAEKGRSLLLKIGDGATAEVFATIAGLRSTSMTINGEQVDVTTKDSNGWRDLMANAGVKSVSVSGAGIFKDSAAEELLRAASVDQTLDNYEIQFQDANKFAGAFQVASLEYSGEHNGAREYSITLESSGVVTFT